MGKTEHEEHREGYGGRKEGRRTLCCQGKRQWDEASVSCNLSRRSRQANAVMTKHHLIQYSSIRDYQPVRSEAAH